MVPSILQGFYPFDEISAIEFGFVLISRSPEIIFIYLLLFFSVAISCMSVWDSRGAIASFQ